MLSAGRHSPPLILSWMLCIMAVWRSHLVGAVEIPLPEENGDPNLAPIKIPDHFLASFGEYPNLLQLSKTDRESFFHPVLVVPKGITPKLLDCRKAKGLASPEFIQRAKRKQWIMRLSTRLRSLQRVLANIWKRKSCRVLLAWEEQWNIGGYDENREEMYSSPMFQKVENQIDGYGGQRTVHLGIDLGGPVGTKVHAFGDGVVHSVGYIPEYGDYGYAIVIQHTLPSGIDVWALYGHLDKSTLSRRKNQPGMTIRKGQVIGRLGDIWSNGGWEAPHCHFQLAMRAPVTHDMPGASSLGDRPQALLDYPDPRYVLGPLY